MPLFLWQDFTKQRRRESYAAEELFPEMAAVASTLRDSKQHTKQTTHRVFTYRIMYERTQHLKHKVHIEKLMNRISAP